MICRIEFEGDQVVISDDGFGMSGHEFLQHWMRIGTTHKVDERISKGGRALSGSKGIGRLSVQFFAKEMTLESTSADEPGNSLYVLVDWTTVIRGKDLDTVNVEWEMRQESPAYPDGHPSGTRITLKNLQSTWDESTLEGLGREVWEGLQVLRRVVVAADHGPHYFGVIPKDLLQQAPRTNGAVPNLGLGIGYFLASDAAEELVQIVHYPHEFDLPLLNRGTVIAPKMSC